MVHEVGWVPRRTEAMGQQALSVLKLYNRFGDDTLTPASAQGIRVPLSLRNRGHRAGVRKGGTKACRDSRQTSCRFMMLQMMALTVVLCPPLTLAACEPERVSNGEPDDPLLTDHHSHSGQTELTTGMDHFECALKG